MRTAGRWRRASSTCWRTRRSRCSRTGRALSDLRQGVDARSAGRGLDGAADRGNETPRNRAAGGYSLHHRLDDARGVSAQARAAAASRRMSPPSSGPARCAPMCSASVTWQPTPAQLAQMRALVRQAMEEGALGVTTALIYSPNDYAKTPELMALASESARCGGIYSVPHAQCEGDRLIEAVQETIDIARTSGAPAGDLSPERSPVSATGTSWMRSSTRLRRRAQRGIRINRGHVCVYGGRDGFRCRQCLPGCRTEAWKHGSHGSRTRRVRTRVLAEMRDPAPRLGRTSMGRPARPARCCSASRTRRSSPSRARRWRKWRSSAA